MNLDLGSTIWLGVTRKLLSYHRWFFAPWNAMPAHVREAFIHHSHTHPNTTQDSVNNYSAHTSPYTSSTNCGSGTFNRHLIGITTWDTHNHVACVIGFGSADLGDPNWWNHQHQVLMVSCSNGGAVHSHGLLTPTLAGSCRDGVCIGSPHTHPTGTCSVDNGGAAHNDHDFAVPTLTDIASGTPAAHQHNVNVFTTNGGSHGHTGSGSVTNALCILGNSHGHNMGAVSATAHPHQFMGFFTPMGGESAVLRRMLVGVGL